MSGCGFGASCGEDHSRCENDNVVVVDGSCKRAGTGRQTQTESLNEWAS